MRRLWIAAGVFALVSIRALGQTPTLNCPDANSNTVFEDLKIHGNDPIEFRNRNGTKLPLKSVARHNEKVTLDLQLTEDQCSQGPMTLTVGQAQRTYSVTSNKKPDPCKEKVIVRMYKDATAGDHPDWEHPAWQGSLDCDNTKLARIGEMVEKIETDVNHPDWPTRNLRWVTAGSGVLTLLALLAILYFLQKPRETTRIHFEDPKLEIRKIELMIRTLRQDWDPKFSTISQALRDINQQIANVTEYPGNGAEKNATEADRSDLLKATPTSRSLVHSGAQKISTDPKSEFVRSFNDALGGDGEFPWHLYQTTALSITNSDERQRTGRDPEYNEDKRGGDLLAIRFDSPDSGMADTYYMVPVADSNKWVKTRVISSAWNFWFEITEAPQHRLREPAIATFNGGKWSLEKQGAIDLKV
jgi:hypothetical protein